MSFILKSSVVNTKVQKKFIKLFYFTLLFILPNKHVNGKNFTKSALLVCIDFLECRSFRKHFCFAESSLLSCRSCMESLNSCSSSANCRLRRHSVDETVGIWASSEERYTIEKTWKKQNCQILLDYLVFLYFFQITFYFLITIKEEKVGYHFIKLKYFQIYLG